MLHKCADKLIKYVQFYDVFLWIKYFHFITFYWFHDILIAYRYEILQSNRRLIYILFELTSLKLLIGNFPLKSTFKKWNLMWWESIKCTISCSLSWLEQDIIFIEIFFISEIFLLENVFLMYLFIQHKK